MDNELKLYEEGYILKEDEFLLKLESNEGKDLQRPIKGFLGKLTQKKKIPLDMIKWGNGRILKEGHIGNKYEDYNIHIPWIYIHKEYFRPKWKIYNYRSGKSQDWVILEHPDGFLIEIYMKNFFSIIKKYTIINGEIIGDFKWDNHKLVDLWPN